MVRESENERLGCGDGEVNKACDRAWLDGSLVSLVSVGRGRRKMTRRMPCAFLAYNNRAGWRGGGDREWWSNSQSVVLWLMLFFVDSKPNGEGAARPVQEQSA